MVVVDMALLPRTWPAVASACVILHAMKLHGCGFRSVLNHVQQLFTHPHVENGLSPTPTHEAVIVVSGFLVLIAICALQPIGCI